MRVLEAFGLATAVALFTGAQRPPAYDLVVYGGTSAGVMAAVQAHRMGKTVVIVGPDKHLGGLSSSGLGYTDTGNKAVIGGLSREFYHRLWQQYQRPETWKWQRREEYGNKGQGTPAIDGENRTMWIFEPHVAEQVFENLVREHEIPVHRDEWLDRSTGVTKAGGRITSIRMLSGRTYAGRMFIDATYEGDLMAAAGVDYHVGREARSTYGEQWNGVQTGVLHHRHHFGVLKKKISPYVVPDDPSSGVLPRISTTPPGEYGQADKRIQAYCYRYCVTDHPDNRIPFPRPDGYDPKQYELLVRVYDAGWRETFDKFDPIPNRKTDSNNHGPFSTDNIGFNYDYPEASYERRREILKAHETYQKGWLYFIANDPRVPKDVQNEMRRWGLPKDEFQDNGGWPHQIYVREARRMIGSFVMTENELLKRRSTPQSVGMGSYTIDSHNVQRYITPEGGVQNEGDIGVPTGGPYEIAYGSLMPKRGQADNLLVPVCVSSSHIAFGSIRMEPVFMVLGQSAATAAALAMDAGVAVQDLPYAQLRERLVKDGQVLEYTAPKVALAAGPATTATAHRAPVPLCAIDMGSNTFRRIVGTFAGGRYEQMSFERKTLGVGDDVTRHGRISEAKMAEIEATLTAFKGSCVKDGAALVGAIGTSAFREAPNAARVVEIATRLSIPMEIATEQRESELAYLVGSLGQDGYAVIDNGSRSIELVARDSGAPRYVVFNLGYRLAYDTFFAAADEPASAVRAFRDRLEQEAAKAPFMRGKKKLVGLEFGEMVDVLFDAAALEGRVLTVHALKQRLDRITSSTASEFRALKKKKEIDRALPRLVVAAFLSEEFGYSQIELTARELGVGLIIEAGLKKP